MFAEDLAPFFDVAGGFAVNATAGPSTFPVIFDNGYQPALDGLVESTGPSCQARTTDVASMAQGSSITINAVAYTIAGVQPDGIGITTLQLRR